MKVFQQAGTLGDWETATLGYSETATLGDWEIGRLRYNDRMTITEPLESRVQSPPVTVRGDWGRLRNIGD